MASAVDDDWLDFEDDHQPPNSSQRSASDIDRSFDRRDFLRQHLKIFKEEYRETAYESEQASTHDGFDHGFQRCVGFSRQLGKAKGALKALKSRDDEAKAAIAKLLDTIDSCLHRIRNVQISAAGPQKPKWDHVDEAGEFDMEFARRALPQYDQEDMELFLGESRDGDAGKTGLGDVRTGGDHWKNVLDGLEKETGEILVTVCDILHGYGVCDGFIYA